MFQTKHEGKDCYDKAMSPETKTWSTRFNFYITPYCKDPLLSAKPSLEFTKNVMFNAIEYMHDNRIFGFT